jgi:ribonuclease HII
VAPDARSGSKGTRRWKAIERELRGQLGPHIAGIDEVGRGPLAGPVVACAVVMPPDQRAIRGVDDSKRLTASERERLAIRIFETAVSVGVGAASVREIDRVNIYHATVIAMRRSLRRLSVVPNHVLIDGKPIRSLETPHTAIVGGDARCYTIACASIIAKVTRDRVMVALGQEDPRYGFELHKGYCSPLHKARLAEHGPCLHHRRCFSPVAGWGPGA